jgi:hypothetical protein
MPEVQGSDHIIAGDIIFVRIKDLGNVSAGLAALGILYGLTSRVDSCNIRIFFPVMMVIRLPVSTCRISMKLGSNARIYGGERANDIG